MRKKNSPHLRWGSNTNPKDICSNSDAQAFYANTNPEFLKAQDDTYKNVNLSKIYLEQTRAVLQDAEKKARYWVLVACVCLLSVIVGALIR